MKIYLISDNVDTYTGMRLAGVEGCVVHKQEELTTRLEQASSDPDTGIIFITEKLERDFPAVISQSRMDHSLPLIAVIPDRHGTTRGKDFITAYVNQSIGLKL